MAPYQAPLRDMYFVLQELAALDEIARLPGFEEAAEVMQPVLQEAATFASEVLDPINRSGDKEGCTWRDGAVATPKGFKEAYAQFARAGWIGLSVPSEHGGQGMPTALSGATLEMWNAANPGFANGPLLNQGAIEAIELTGSQDQKQQYIPKLVSGEWMGTMCLTEPQAGSDLAQVRTKAIPEGDHYKIIGQKIFITFGEHDMADNIIHLVLARLPDAPAGTKGISMFIVPKFLVNADGTLGERNDVFCAGIEHKLGLNANPTCTLNYGEKGGAIGYLIGAPNEGLKNMFIMMNAARFSVGVQGLAIADRAYQSALQYTRERVQSRDVASGSPEPRRIIEHPDVRRMLMSMKAQIEGMRALAYTTAAALDRANKDPDPKVQRDNKAFVELMIPVVKGWCTETAVEVCSVALQVFGGLGYIEETGIAQQYRDVRITTIYEGTTGIQALDLVGRKLAQDMGATAAAVIAKMRECHDEPTIKAIDQLEQATRAIGMNAMGNLHTAIACSVPYLKLWGIVAGGWQMARAAKIAEAKIASNDPDSDFYRAKRATAKFYATHVLPQASALAREVIDGSADVMSLGESQFDLDRKASVLT